MTSADIRTPRWLLVGNEERRQRVSEWFFSMGFLDFSSVSVFRPAGETAPEIIFLVSPEPSIVEEIESIDLLSDTVVVLLEFKSDRFREPSMAALSHWDDIIPFQCTTVFFEKKLKRAVELFSLRQSSRKGARLQKALLTLQDKLFATKGSIKDLRSALSTISNVLAFDRASLIAYVPPSSSAYVLAATDDPDGLEFVLKIERYPEIREAVLSESPLIVEDFSAHPITRKISRELTSKQIGSVSVFPVYWQGAIKGVCVLRHASPRKNLTPMETEWLKGVTVHLGAYVNDFAVYERFRTEKNKLSTGAFEAERRIRSIESLKELFDSASEGTLVLSPKGEIYYCNHAALSIFEVNEKQAEGANISLWIQDADRDFVDGLLASTSSERPLHPFDLILNVEGKQKTLSVTMSKGFQNIEGWIWTFRDVTIERNLELELRHTKDFLENLVHSAVDAIVAADRDGKVVLFNPGAERIFGLHSFDVIHKKHVKDLYPAGVAEKNMSYLRSSGYGGVGKLEQTRSEVLSSHDETIPVHMTAAIIYEDGIEVGTVGVFTDLREELEMERRLLQAQAKLEEQKRIEMMAELAGATAHELNQPLTTLVMVGDLLKKHKHVGDDVRTYLDAMSIESSKMAKIVKKIGEITKYETISYVGDSAILDLGRSSSQRQPPLDADEIC